MHDMYDEGLGAAMCGVTRWPDVVMGRFLKEWERRALAAGWRAGCRDRDSYRADMASAVDVFADGEPLPL